MQDKLLEVVLKNLDEEQLLVDLMNQIAKPAIEKVVNNTPTKVDDVLVDVLFDQLSKTLVEELLKLIKE